MKQLPQLQEEAVFSIANAPLSVKMQNNSLPTKTAPPPQRPSKMAMTMIY
jgi:hypothetical protein